MEQEPTPGSQKPTRAASQKLRTTSHQLQTARHQNREMTRKLHINPTLGKPMQIKVIQCHLEAIRRNYREIQVT